MNRLIHDAAKRELREAVQYYADISPELGARFYLEIEQVITEICEQPLLFRVFDDPTLRHFATHFPYCVIYFIESDLIWIIAVMHLHRDPGYWTHRLT